MKKPSSYKGIIELSDRSKKRVKLMEDEEILFCIGEIRWISDSAPLGVDVVRMRPSGLFDLSYMKNMIVTSKRIILPMTSFFGYNTDYIDLFYKESFLDEFKGTLYKRYGFWVSGYALGEDSVIFDLKGKKFDLQIILLSSATDKIVEVLSEQVGVPKE